MFAKAFAIPLLVLCHPAWATVPASSFPIKLTADETAALESEACLAPFGTNIEKAEVTSHWGPWEAERQANDHRAAVTCAPVTTGDDAAFRRTAWCTWQPGRWSCDWESTFVELAVEGKKLKVQFPSKSFPAEADVVRILKDIGAAIREWPTVPKGTLFTERSSLLGDRPAPLEGDCRISSESAASWPDVDIELWCDDRSVKVTKECRPDCFVWFSSYAPPSRPLE